MLVFKLVNMHSFVWLNETNIMAITVCKDTYTVQLILSSKLAYISVPPAQYSLSIIASKTELMI